MSHYVSNQNLSKSNKSFVNQLSTGYIPNSVQKALANPRWKDDMNEEMSSLKRIKLGIWLIALKERNHGLSMDLYCEV